MDTPTADQVTRYLRENPDFLLVQPQILTQLAPPPRWTGDTVVDFQRHMVDVLRGELAGLRDCASAVIETNRSNLGIQAQTHAAALSIVGAPDLDELVRVVAEDLPAVLGIETATLALEPLAALDDAIMPMIAKLSAGDVDAILGRGRDVRLIANLTDDGLLFADTEPAVHSAALVRLTLSDPQVHGLMALGAQHEGFFRPGQGCDLVLFLAQMVEVCLQRLLPKQV